MDAAGCAHGEPNVNTSSTSPAGNAFVLAAAWRQHEVKHLATTADTCVAGC
jgi:hypothetical protein